MNHNWKDIETSDPGLNEWCILLGYRGSVAHGMYVPNSDPNSIDDSRKPCREKGHRQTPDTEGPRPRVCRGIRKAKWVTPCWRNLKTSKATRCLL